MATVATPSNKATVSVPTASENVLSAKTDVCVSNAIVKGGIGLGVGVVLSAVLFRRRAWPVLIGLGFGAGQGYSDCDRIFNPAAIPGFVIQGQETVPTAFSTYNPFTKLESKAKSAAATTETKASSIVEQAKAAAHDAKEKVVAKAHEVEAVVSQKAQQAETKVEAGVEKMKDSKKWV